MNVVKVALTYPFYIGQSITVVNRISCFGDSNPPPPLARLLTYGTPTRDRNAASHVIASCFE